MVDTFKSPTHINWNAGGHTGLAQYGSDANLLVIFYSKAVENAAKSIEHGRRWTEDQVYVRIQHPGETLNIIDRPIEDTDKIRFQSQWTKFIHNQAQVVEGTSVDLLFPNYPSVAENLRGYGIQTVEQCANLSAHAIATIGMGAQEYVNRAKKYLEQANSSQGFHVLQKELDDQKSKNRVLERQLIEMKRQLDTLTLRAINPQGAMLNPPFIQGYDAQSERINANHPTNELVQKATKERKTKKLTVQEAAQEIQEIGKDATA